jgi:tRNA threonylcarbamoyladenosine biosynthesis protein TsaB
MFVLGLDTSGTEIAVVLCQSGAPVQQRVQAQARQQGELLLTLVDDVLHKANCDLADLAALAVVTGPGSFTGLRLGLAAALGLARAKNIPVTGYDRFSLFAPTHLTPTALVFESLRTELYVQLPGMAPQMLTPEQITALWQGPVAGDGAVKLPAHSQVALPLGAELVAKAATRALQAGQALPVATPYYLRPPDVTMPVAR